MRNHSLSALCFESIHFLEELYAALRFGVEWNRMREGLEIYNII